MMAGKHSKDGNLIQGWHASFGRATKQIIEGGRYWEPESGSFAIISEVDHLKFNLGALTHQSRAFDHWGQVRVTVMINHSI